MSDGFYKDSGYMDIIRLSRYWDDFLIDFEDFLMIWGSIINEK